MDASKYIIVWTLEPQLWGQLGKRTQPRETKINADPTFDFVIRISRVIKAIWENRWEERLPLAESYFRRPSKCFSRTAQINHELGGVTINCEETKSGWLYSMQFSDMSTEAGVFDKPHFCILGRASVPHAQHLILMKNGKGARTAGGKKKKEKNCL